MDSTGGIIIEQLEAKIRERKELIKRIVPFVISIVKERGQVISNLKINPGAPIKAGLNGFVGFRFEVDIGHTIMGGNTIKVWSNFHPNKTRVPELVFDVYYQAHVNECEVRQFIEDTYWITALIHVIEHKQEIVSQMDKAAAEKLEQQRLQEEEGQKQKRLFEEAKRLKISL